MIRCHVCLLDSEKLAAINDGLRAQLPLAQLSEISGVSKSSLSRHTKHLDERLPTRSPAPAIVRTPPAAPAPPPAPAAPSAVAAPHTPACAIPSKETLLQRIEQLWAESIDGLEASKETIKVLKPNGESLEVPGDLRSRVGFIREGRGVLELAGLATGHFQRGGEPSGAQVAIQIVCPAGSEPRISTEDGGVVLDITPRR
jgi:hypothetical protein